MKSSLINLDPAYLDRFVPVYLVTISTYSNRRPKIRIDTQVTNVNPAVILGSSVDTFPSGRTVRRELCVTMQEALQLVAQYTSSDEYFSNRNEAADYYYSSLRQLSPV